MATFCRWLSSGLIGVLVSCLAFVACSIAYERLALQQRLGVDDDVTWLALAAGPALIVAIHRIFHRSKWIAAVTLAAGVLLAGVGTIQLVAARAATSRHVPSGAFSGIEHLFASTLALFVLLTGVLAAVAAVLSLRARHLSRASASLVEISESTAP